MKFNKVAVLMNPPYQIQSEAQQGREGGKAQAKPIYHSFIETVIDFIKPDYMVSINPSRWMVGGMGLDSFRERMMNDRHMKKIVHFAGESEVFNTVLIKGGVNYFDWEKDYNGECEFCHGNTSSNRFLNTHDIVLQDNNAFGILEKVMNNSTKFINQTCYGNKPFGIATNFKNWVEPAIGGDLTGHIHGIDITMCYASNKSLHEIKISDFSDKNNIRNKWKVCTSAGINPSKETGGFDKYNNLFLIEPTAICTETYIVVNVFDNKKEAEHFISYMKTKFFRFMLGLRVLTQHINKEKFSWVPDMLDYSAPWTDAELYKKFNLTRQEVAYIESKIKTI
jgi:site-specific DNA-methyltransferase (adenine-specific)